MAAGEADRARSSQSELVVDLGAVVANWRKMAAAAQGVACAGVVKADGYGLGAVPVARALAAAGCRRFFVAHLGEGVDLRAALAADCAIYVLNGLLPGESDEFLAHDLTPVLNDLGQIAAWAAEAQHRGAALPAVVHADTGMSRLGLPPAEAARLADEPSRLAGLAVDFVMSHLACADEPDHPLNRAQLAEFAAWRARFPQLRASLANSSGIFLGPEYRFDLVRPGCALYGVNPRPGRPNELLQAARLLGKILQIRHVDPPRTVGYGAAHRVDSPTRVATVAMGYADGWLREFSNRGWAYWNDIRTPFIGRVSMDLITLDMTAAPAARAGDAVELLGPRAPVDDVAAVAGTIGYEVLTRLGKRFRRTYIQPPAARA